MPQLGRFGLYLWNGGSIWQWTCIADYGATNSCGGHITTWSVLLGAALSYPAACFLVGGSGNGLTLTFLLGMVIYVLHLRQKNTPIMINALGLVLSVVAMLITGMQTKEAYHLFFVGLCVLIVYFAAALGAGVSDIVFNRRCR